MRQRLALADEAATIQLGTTLAKHLPENTAGWLFLLQGELGAGKSTLARALIRGLGHEGPVPSPTYTLVEPYEFTERLVYHVDLYRIGSADELEFLGWDELGDGLLLVEWPERVPELLTQADLRLQLAYDGDGRSITMEAQSERAIAWQAALSLAPELATAVVP
ncbi:MAG: tRNA (adenosine(37)-N6)-threonylcarbamoyltransferase complex ATPase subunit type 1 TsaE [Woeseia sp.]